MQQEDRELLEYLGFKPCRLKISHRDSETWSLNGFLVTKHSTYWCLRGDFPIELCEIYKDIKNIRPQCQKTSKKYKQFLRDMVNKLHLEIISWTEFNDICKSYDLSKDECYIEDLDIDTNISFVKVVEDIKRLNLRMEW